MMSSLSVWLSTISASCRHIATVELSTSSPEDFLEVFLVTFLATDLTAADFLAETFAFAVFFTAVFLAVFELLVGAFFLALLAELI